MFESILSGLSDAGGFLSGLGAVGGLFGGGGLSSRKAMALQAQYNREVMQNQLQWRKQDAEAAGIHPLYAMGAPTTSFAPSVVGDDGPNLGDKLMHVGQNVSRAANAFSNKKAEAIELEQRHRLNEATIQGQELSNQKTASEIALMTQPGHPPGIGNGNIIAGQGNGIISIPSEYVPSRRNRIGTEAAPPSPAGKEFVYDGGTTLSYPSEKIKNSIEDVLPYEIEHYFLNRVAPGIEKYFLDPAYQAGRYTGEFSKKVRKRMWTN
jgi:hypothetical protein